MVISFYIIFIYNIIFCGRSRIGDKNPGFGSYIAENVKKY